MSDGAPRVPRSSLAHLVYKFGGAVQQVLDLVTQIDAKTLSDKQTQRVRKRIHDLDGALWPDEQHGDAGVVDFRITSAQAQKSAADGLREAQAKIEKLQADLEVAKNETRVESDSQLTVQAQLKNEIKDIFASLGFEIAEGPEIETQWFNFEA